jgi:hypothetical protein
LKTEFFFKGIQSSIDKNEIEQESQLVLKFWEKITDKQTDVYLGRNKDDHALSWTDLDALDLFRKVLKNQQMLNLKHLNTLDENSNYIKTNIVSIGGPKRNNISKEILGKLQSISKYRFVNDEMDNYQIIKGDNVISDVINKDFALFYFSKQQNINWTVFAGLTKYSTIACLEALLEEEFIKDLNISLDNNFLFLEILFSFDVFGERRINTKIVYSKFE